MIPTRKLTGTSVSTSAVGFGCAGLWRLPGRRERMSVLDAAFDAGIRHFDVAPMYGLGLAETELGAFFSRRRGEITLTTKFGIDPTLLTKTLAPLQGPARAVLAKRPSVNEGLKERGKNSDSGLVGRLLYRTPRLSVSTAQRSLEASLRALRTDHIDVFLLHDPMADRLADPSELADYLDRQCKAGRIRCWGVTGMPDTTYSVRELLRWPAVTQHRDDVFVEASFNLPAGARITYGALARTVGIFRQYFTQTPGAGAFWSERLGVDMQEDSSLPQLLLRSALSRNPAGPVIFTTTKSERVGLAAEAASNAAPSSSVSMAFTELTSVVRDNIGGAR